MNIYDFDHAVYNGDSSVDFFLYVLSRKPYRAVLLPYQLWGIVRYLIDEFYSDSDADIPLARMSKNAFRVHKNNGLV